MTFKIHELANILHKRMDQVISDLQIFGVNVTKYYDIVQEPDAHTSIAPYFVWITILPANS